MNDLDKKKSERRTLWATLAVLAVGYLLLSDLMGGTFWTHQGQDSYTLQAINWLAGRMYLKNGEQYTWLELAIYQGRYYVSFPPLPSVVMVPFVLLFGENTPNNLLVGVYGLISVALAFRILLERGRSPRAAAFWGIFLVWGSNYLWMTTYGGVWFQAQDLNMVLCLAGILAALRHKRSLCTSLLALAVGCRPFSAAYLAAFYLWFAWQDREAFGFGRALLCNWRCCIGPVIVASALMWYNWARFNNPLEFGHDWLPEFTEAEYGQFNVHYLWPNLKNILFTPVKFTDRLLSFPIFNGFMFYIANPMFLVLFAWQLNALIRRNFTALGILLTAAMIINLLLLCMHKTFGGWQFGARYTCDLLPFALLYIAEKGAIRPRTWELCLCGCAVAFNAYGVIWMFLNAK